MASWGDGHHCGTHWEPHEGPADPGQVHRCEMWESALRPWPKPPLVVPTSGPAAFEESFWLGLTPTLQKYPVSVSVSRSSRGKKIELKGAVLHLLHTGTAAKRGQNETVTSVLTR